ncbi:MAG: Lsr2 family DNA-binding protein [Georgenia sp.]
MTATAPHPLPAPAEVPGLPEDVAGLLVLAAKSESANIAAAGGRAQKAIARVRELLEEEQAKRRAKAHAAAERARLQAELDKHQKAEAEIRRQLAAYKVKTAPTGGPSAQEVRAWARERGITVPDRGLLQQSVRDAYNEAHQ